MELDREVQHFEKHRQEWLKHYRGQYALVKGEDLVGTFTTTEEAHAEGFRRFGTEPFLVRQVTEEEPVESIPALTLGLIDAHP